MAGNYGAARVAELLEAYGERVSAENLRHSLMLAVLPLEELQARNDELCAGVSFAQVLHAMAKYSGIIDWFLLAAMLEQQVEEEVGAVGIAKAEREVSGGH